MARVCESLALHPAQMEEYMALTTLLGAKMPLEMECMRALEALQEVLLMAMPGEVQMQSPS